MVVLSILCATQVLTNMSVYDLRLVVLSIICATGVLTNISVYRFRLFVLSIFCHTEVLDCCEVEFLGVQTCWLLFTKEDQEKISS